MRWGRPMILLPLSISSKASQALLPSSQTHRALTRLQSPTLNINHLRLHTASRLANTLQFEQPAPSSILQCNGSTYQQSSVASYAFDVRSVVPCCVSNHKKHLLAAALRRTRLSMTPLNATAPRPMPTPPVALGAGICGMLLSGLFDTRASLYRYAAGWGSRFVVGPSATPNAYSPNCIVRFIHAYICILSNNRLSGTMPASISQLTALTYLCVLSKAGLLRRTQSCFVLRT
jgi:hypothetical protein